MILSESVVVKPKKLVLLLVISCQTAHVIVDLLMAEDF